MRTWMKRRRTRDRELDEEIAFDLAAEAREKIEAGMSPEDAALSSRKEFGNVLLAKEATRDVWTSGSMERLAQDIRYSVRQFAHSPRFAFVVVLSMALGIGANTAIFTVLNNALLKTLPVSHPDELVMLTLGSGQKSKGSANFTNEMWKALRDRDDLFTGIFAYGSTRVDVRTAQWIRPLPAGFVTGGFFSTLGIGPTIGRTLAAADDRPGCPAVAVLSHAFWRSEYGGTDVVGKPITLDGHDFQIIGVAAKRFFGVEFGYHVPIWVPFCTETMMRGSEGTIGRVMVGRPRPGVGIQEIRARLEALGSAVLQAARPVDAPPEGRAPPALLLAPFSKGIPALATAYAKPLVILQATVGIVLLIACANITSLLMARGAARQRELAVRLALGASQGRLLRQLLTEGLLLSLGGAAVGVFVAYEGAGLLTGFLSQPGNPVSLDVTPDLTVLAFTTALGLLTGVLFAVAPALRAVRVDPHLSMKTRGRGQGPDPGRSRMGSLLLAGQLALSLVCMVGAGLLLASWWRLAGLDAGLHSEGVVLAHVSTRSARIPTEDLGATYVRILERMRAVPGVVVAAAAARTPIDNTGWSSLMDPTGSAQTVRDIGPVQLNEVSDGYFAVMGIPLVAGRDFGRNDSASAPRVAIVTEKLAQTFYRNSNPLGQHLRLHAQDGFGPPMEIVGVAADVKQNQLFETSQPLVYLPLGQDPRPFPGFSFAARVANSLRTSSQDIQSAVKEVQPALSADVTTLKQQLEESVRLPRALGMVSGAFGALALLLASVGLYGTTSYSVARRRNEIGLRLALGATRLMVVRMVLREAGQTAGAGLIVGAALSFALMRLISDLLFGVTPNDPTITALAVLTLCLVTAVAALAPALRAARQNLPEALREE